MKKLLYLAILSLFFSTTTLGQEVPQKAPVKGTKVKEKTEKVEAVQTGDYQLYLKNGEKSPKWDEFISPAFGAFDSGNLATAYVFLKKAYEAGSRDGLVLYRLGMYMSSIGKYQEAANLLLEAADKIQKQYPGSPISQKINEYAGVALFQIDNHDFALIHLKKALELSPENFTLLYMAGQIQRTKKMKPEARGFFERALTAKIPEGVPPEIRQKVLDELVAITFDLKDYDACKAYLAELQSKYPYDPIITPYQQKLESQIKKKGVLEKMSK